jgi:D-glycerate 3-kinase
MAHQSVDKLNIDISAFIAKHQLPASFQAHAERWFFALAEQITLHHIGAGKPIVVGINGAQGSGKSTLADLLAFLFNTHFELHAVSLSIDDFYYTRDERKHLAETIHPLLLTRGVPGTHDVELALQTINDLQNHHLPVTLPSFNKATDDRCTSESMQVISKPVDIIILEGWCMGASAQTQTALASKINRLELAEDLQGNWRAFVNAQLATRYPALFELVDIWTMLKAPSFDCVYQWRLEQEAKLKQKSGHAQHVMSEVQVARFIQFFQRITEHNLIALPAKMHFLYELDSTRQITKMTTKPIVQTNDKAWVIFTDMDGTLLDHFTYQFDDAIPTLNALHTANIPVIPITSKTYAEVSKIRDDLNNKHPFIIENGAAVFIPVGYFESQPEGTTTQGDFWVKAFVEPRAQWQALIEKIRPQYADQFITFSDAGVEGIMEMTGLSEVSASKAAQRQYGEPMSWLGTPEQKSLCINALNKMGAHILEGGRFVHVSGKSDKGVALTWLKNIYQLHSSKQVTSMALGDSHNDKAMLEIADYAVIIRSPVHAPPTINREKQLITTTKYGPAGWAEAVNEIIGAGIK